MRNKSTRTYLVRRIKKRIPALVLMTLAHMGSAVLGVVFALGTRNVINTAVAGAGEDFFRACWQQAAIIAGLLLCLTVYRYLHDKLQSKMDADWKESLLDSLLHSRYADVSAYHSGELINRLGNDVRTVNEGLLGSLPGLASMICRLVAVIGVLWALAPVFTLVMLALGIAVIGATAAVRRRLKTMHKAVSAAEGRLSGFLQEVLEKLLPVQAMGVQAEVERRAGSLVGERYRLQRRRQKVSLCANSFVSILGYGSGFAALVWCAFGVYNGTMGFGDLTAITQLVAQLQGPMVNLSGFLPKYIAMTAALERLMEIDTLDPDSGEEGEARESLYQRAEALYCEDLSFSYGREQVLHDCSFRLPKGSFAVVLGSSGIGKSTLLKLLLGIFEPDGGTLALDCGGEKVPIGRATRSLFAYVPQGNLLFSGSIRENLLLTRPGATEAEIEQAVYVSAMDQFLPSLPEGLDTVIGENAEGLSEGQAQRLAIARAVLGGAPVLLLDEITSALDSETEMLVLGRIRNLPGRSIIAVTHRPAALEMADWQLDVEDGVIRAKELQDKNPG